MSRTLIIDNVCPKPYDIGTLVTRPMGGTEATVVRVAERLGLANEVVVSQHNRPDSFQNGSGSVTYGGPHYDGSADNVIVLRQPSYMGEARRRYPDAKLVLWLHDLVGMDIAHHVDLLTRTETTVVCVSEFHRTQCIEALRVGGYNGQFAVKRVYNPIDDGLKPDDTDYNKNKLVFFSSPHKGLERTLHVFKLARTFIPALELYIANPGYYADRIVEGLPGVIALGPMAHSDVLKHVRDSLAVFHLNDVFPETFGLVYAEANAVGTPFLTHSLGATFEVSDHPAQLVNVKDNKQVIDRLLAWHGGNRPIVRGNPDFRLSKVVQDWARLLS